MEHIFALVITAGVLYMASKVFGSKSSSGSTFLCDNCLYDYDSACYNRQRPNARTCSDHKRRY